MLNHAQSLEYWGAEFLTRTCPELSTARIELRVGAPGEHVIQIAREEKVDLIVLAWSRDLSGGHAQVVLDVISSASVPTVLLPMATALADPSAEARDEARSG